MPDDVHSDGAGIRDELIVKQVDTSASAHVAGPDVAHWGEGQLIAPPDVDGGEQLGPDGKPLVINGPDHEHWGTPEEREAAEAIRVAEQAQGEQQ